MTLGRLLALAMDKLRRTIVIASRHDLRVGNLLAFATEATTCLRNRVELALQLDTVFRDSVSEHSKFLFLH